MQRTTSIILGTELQKLVERWLASGRYGNVSEVMREAVRALEEREARIAAQWAYAVSVPTVTYDELDETEKAMLDGIDRDRANGVEEGPYLTSAEFQAELDRENGLS